MFALFSWHILLSLANKPKYTPSLKLLKLFQFNTNFAVINIFYCYLKLYAKFAWILYAESPIMSWGGDIPEKSYSSVEGPQIWIHWTPD